MQNQPMVRFGNDRLGQMRHQSFLRFQDILGVLRQADAVRHAENVGVHGHRGLIKGHSHHHIGGLAAHAGELLQVFQIVGNHAVEVAHQGLGHAQEVLGLVVGIGNAFDVGVDLLHRPNNAGVVILTRLSVHCAERITATKSWYGFS